MIEGFENTGSKVVRRRCVIEPRFVPNQLTETVGLHFLHDKIATGIVNGSNPMEPLCSFSVRDSPGYYFCKVEWEVSCVNKHSGSPSRRLHPVEPSGKGFLVASKVHERIYHLKSLNPCVYPFRLKRCQQKRRHASGHIDRQLRMARKWFRWPHHFAVTVAEPEAIKVHTIHRAKHIPVNSCSPIVSGMILCHPPAKSELLTISLSSL